MINLSGLTTFSSGGSRAAKTRRRGAGLGVLGAFNAASQIALLYPPSVDGLVRRELDRIPERDDGAGRLR